MNLLLALALLAGPSDDITPTVPRSAEIRRVLEATDYRAERLAGVRGEGPFRDWSEIDYKHYEVMHSPAGPLISGGDCTHTIPQLGGGFIMRCNPVGGSSCDLWMWVVGAPQPTIDSYECDELAHAVVELDPSGLYWHAYVFPW